MSRESGDVRDARIRAAGVVQSVIASGAPVEEWVTRSAYGLACVSYLAGKLLKQNPKAPPIPKSLQKESNRG